MTVAAESQPTNYTVVGAGAWGTALAIMLARAGHAVSLITGSDEKADAIQSLKINDAALRSIRLPESLTAHSFKRDSAWHDSLSQSPQAVIVLAVPAQATRQMARSIHPFLRPGHDLVITAKGLERGTQKRLTTVVQEEAPDPAISVLSGPSFAHDVARGLPTAVTLAAPTLDQADRLCELLKGPNFRPYASDDLIGVQLGGALKNVLAIAAGVVDGKGLGESAKAALITRGFAELSRLAISQGARAETLAGLSGLGDLILTCSTAGSRNFRFGYEIGRGAETAKLMAEGQPLAEGAKTASAALALGQAAGIDMPITQTVAQVVENHMSVDDAIDSLMARPLKRE
jgi:glycerol-3-phosphate dehydrogenase (NAD(P)+)